MTTATEPFEERDVPFLLQQAADGVDVAAPPVDTIIGRARFQRRRRWTGVTLASMAAAAALVVAVVAVRGSDRPEGVVRPATPSLTCPAAVTAGVLPAWARTGFSDPEPVMPYVLGDRGDIVAIIFGDPLQAPPGPDRSNKILWVSRVPVGGDALRIEASLAGTDVVVHQEVAGGPGPSGVDLPRPGCWLLRLSWSGHTDTLRLRYVPAEPLGRHT